MKQNVRLSVFYSSLVLFMVFLVLFEEQNEPTDPVYIHVDEGGRFRSPRIWGQLIPEDDMEESISSSWNLLGNAQAINGNESLSPVGRSDRYGNFSSPPVYVNAMPEEFHDSERDVDPYLPGLKKILVWSYGYGEKTMAFGYGRAPFVAARCQVDTCLLTGNRSLVPLQQFDALVFHFRATDTHDMPRFRSSHQRWVFWEIESASYIYQEPSHYNGVFNWSMTYRRDSDIPIPYGQVYHAPRPDSQRDGSRNYASGKTKLAAWFASNCMSHSRREKLVKFLQQFIQVDVYGKCGPLKCSREDPDKCYKMLEKDYKFYLSFENSLCKDYVTEKFLTLLRYDVVPVVLGLGQYAELAPPHSYINVLDFTNLQDLVGHLKYLDANDTAYNEYFRWKGSYLVDDGWSNRAQGFCHLCRRLHQDTVPKVYQDLRQWFVSQGECKKLDTKTWRKWYI